MTSQSFSKSITKFFKKHRWPLLLLVPAWACAMFFAVQFLVVFVAQQLFAMGVPLDQINPVVFNTTFSALSYLLALIIVVAVPWYLFKDKTTWKDLGAHDLPSWMDILLSPLAFVVYLISSAVVAAVVTRFVELSPVQQIPFSKSMLVTNWQYILAFVTLVVLAPLAEELLFRGYVYSKLRKIAPMAVAIIINASVFGLMHLWGGPDQPLQWLVMFDTFVLSIFLCLLREYTGAIWASVLLHMIKNGLAFYMLFINPTLLQQMKSAILPFI